MSVNCAGCGDQNVSNTQVAAMASIGRRLGGDWKWWCDGCVKKGLPQEDGRRFWAEFAAKKSAQQAAEEAIKANELVAEIAQLKALLNRAQGSIHAGFIGGEWAHLVFQRDQLCVAAIKEADEAEQVVREIAHFQGNKYGENAYWLHNYNQTEPLRFDDAYNEFSKVQEHVDDYRAVIKEHEETISRCQTEARRLGRELNAAKAEVERLREAAKHAFTLEQITATMLKAIDEASNNSTPMPRRQRSLEAVKKKEDKEQREFDERVELACERYRKATEAQQKQCSECGSNNTKRRLYVPTSRPEQWWDCQDCKHYWVEAH